MLFTGRNAVPFGGAAGSERDAISVPRPTPRPATCISLSKVKQRTPLLSPPPSPPARFQQQQRYYSECYRERSKGSDYDVLSATKTASTQSWEQQQWNRRRQRLQRQRPSYVVAKWSRCTRKCLVRVRNKKTPYFEGVSSFLHPVFASLSLPFYCTLFLYLASLHLEGT